MSSQLLEHNNDPFQNKGADTLASTLWRFFWFRLPGVLVGLVLGTVYGAIWALGLLGQTYAKIMHITANAFSKQWSASPSIEGRLWVMLVFLSYILTNTLIFLCTAPFVAVYRFLDIVGRTAFQKGFWEGVPGVFRAAAPTEFDDDNSLSQHFDAKAWLMLALIGALAIGILFTVLFATGGFSVMGFAATSFGFSLSVFAPLSAAMPAVLGVLTFLSTAVMGFIASLIVEASLYLGGAVLRSVGVAMSVVNPSSKFHAKMIWPTFKSSFPQRLTNTEFSSAVLPFFLYLLTRDAVHRFFFEQLPAACVGLPLMLLRVTFWQLAQFGQDINLLTRIHRENFSKRWDNAAEGNLGYVVLARLWAVLAFALAWPASVLMTALILPFRYLLTLALSVFNVIGGAMEHGSIAYMLAQPWEGVNTGEVVTKTIDLFPNLTCSSHNYKFLLLN